VVDNSAKQYGMKFRSCFGFIGPYQQFLSQFRGFLRWRRDINRFSQRIDDPIGQRFIASQFRLV